MRADAALPGRTSWAATAGAMNYQLQIERDGGPWRSLARAITGSRAVRLLYEGGSRYRARLRVQSATGAWSSWTYSSSTAPARFQETSATIGYTGSWTSSTSPGASGGHVRFASRGGATARFSFIGRAVGWVATRGPSRGSARIYVDGVYRTTVSLYRSSTLARSVAFATSWPAGGPHTLIIETVGTIGHPRIDLDLLAVLR
jgi:hypothetical protein